MTVAVLRAVTGEYVITTRNEAGKAPMPRNTGVDDGYRLAGSAAQIPDGRNVKRVQLSGIAISSLRPLEMTH